MKKALLLAVLFVLCASAVAAAELKLIAGGDIYLGKWVEDVVEQKGEDYPFSRLKPILEGADIRVANLEAPFTEVDKELVEKQYLFRVDPRMVDVLRAGSIDVVFLANNHILDYGMEGLADTIKVLSLNGIGYTGAGTTLRDARRPWIVEKKGIKVAFLAYSNTFPEQFFATKKRGGTARGLVRYVRSDVRRARRVADFVVVSFHWGQEGMKGPKPYQRLLAHVAIDSGASLVVGHHPHVLQPLEIYRGGIIVYSLGNLLFGSYSKRDVEGALLEVVLVKGEKRGQTRRGIAAFRLIPLDVNNHRVGFRPLPLEQESIECRFEGRKRRCAGG